MVCVEGIFTEGGSNELPALEISSSLSFLPALMALTMECMEPECVQGDLTTQLNCTHPDLAASLLELLKKRGWKGEWRWRTDIEFKHNDEHRWTRRNKKAYLEPADVKSPHTSELGWAAGTGDPKSKRGAGSAEMGKMGENEYRFISNDT